MMQTNTVPRLLLFDASSLLRTKKKRKEDWVLCLIEIVKRNSQPAIDDWTSMFSYLRKPSLSSIISGDTSFSSDNSYVPPIATPPPAVLRQLVVRDLDEISSSSLYQQRPLVREPFRIPRPIVTIPRPLIHLPTNSSLWTPYARPTHVQEFSSSSSPSATGRFSEYPFYQNLPPLLPLAIPPPPPPPLPPLPTQYHFVPAPFQRFSPAAVARTRRPKKPSTIKPPGLFTTLCSGGFSTIAALIYLSVSLALPIAKLVLGILYVKECPVNQLIPLYMIVAGGCGVAVVVLILLSSASNYTRSLIRRERAVHELMLCTIAFARGMKGVIDIFLFIWFFFGNVWVFGVRFRVRTDKPNDLNNYCHPGLYWFAFYVLIFTYVHALFTCCAKFCFNFFCCGACDIWRKAFS